MLNKIVPILHYDFEHFTEDGKVEDMSGNGYHGTISGATRCEDMWGNPNAAMSFESTDSSYVSFDPITLSVSGLSIILLYTATVPLSNYSGIGHLLSYSSKYTNYVGLDPNNVSVASEGDVNGEFIFSNTPIGGIFSKWNCLALTSSSSTSKVFLNGELKAIDTTVDGNELIIGKINSQYSDAGFSGAVATLKCYDQELTPTQVKHISTQMMRKIGRQ